MGFAPFKKRQRSIGVAPNLRNGFGLYRSGYRQDGHELSYEFTKIIHQTASKVNRPLQIPLVGTGLRTVRPIPPPGEEVSAKLTEVECGQLPKVLLPSVLIGSFPHSSPALRAPSPRGRVLAGRGAPRSESAILMLAGGKHTAIHEGAAPYVFIPTYPMPSPGHCEEGECPTWQSILSAVIPRSIATRNPHRRRRSFAVAQDDTWFVFANQYAHYDSLRAALWAVARLHGACGHTWCGNLSSPL